MKKIELNLDLLQRYLGSYEKKAAKEYVWQCPCCADLGRDRHKDNLKFNAERKILYCFADPEHSKEILKDIFKQEYENNKSLINFEPSFNYQEIEEKADYDKELNPIRLAHFKERMLYYNKSLLADNFMLDCINHERSLNKYTLEKILLGCLNRDRWCLPTIKYSTNPNFDDIEVIGFEYRIFCPGKKIIKREKDTPSHLAMINCYNPKTEILIVVEGYFDGYALFQYLTEKEQIEYYHIVTCSNGVNVLQKQLAEVNYSKYKKYILMIDNDHVGRQAADRILEEYPFFENLVVPNGYKDFGDYYEAYKKENTNE